MVRLEEERRRISRELHDEAGQSLLLLRLQLELMEREAPPEFRPRLAEARGIAEHTVDELRRIVAGLNPAGLERLGLEQSLRDLAARFRRMCPARLRLSITAPAGLPLRVEAAIYRVAQEALHNVASHARATRVNLSLHAADHWVRLCITDDGAGFHTENSRRNPASRGLAGMRQRAALLGGSLQVHSAPGKGTSVILQLPRDIS